jgi:formylmethanofuran:tetrahydromethanopterin formyltransferase
MAYFDLSNYETVEERLAKFWELYPNGRVFTEIVHYDDKRVLIKASVYKNVEQPVADSTGYAEEVFGSSPVNKTSFVENCETSAIGRACANMNLSSRGKRPSREEMAKAQRRSNEQEPTTESGITGTQVKFINDKALALGLNPTEYTSAVLGREIRTLPEIKATEVSKVLKALASTKGEGK